MSNLDGTILWARKVIRWSRNRLQEINKQTYTIIIKLSSKFKVDEIIRYKSLHRLLTSDNVFVSTTTNHEVLTIIKINRMLPSKLYKLFLHALILSKSNNLQKPYIKNYTFFMRLDANYASFTIKSVESLHNLIPMMPKL